MKETKYIRRGQKIETVERDEKNNLAWSKDYGSINKAKRASRELQIDEDGALGLGSVQIA